jgi:hypothetical protein
MQFSHEHSTHAHIVHPTDMIFRKAEDYRDFTNWLKTR